MNFEQNLSNLMSPKVIDPEVIEMREGRRNMAFDVCFQLTYPDLTEDKLRTCLNSYKKYNRVVESALGQAIKKKRESKDKTKAP